MGPETSVNWVGSSCRKRLATFSVLLTDFLKCHLCHLTMKYKYPSSVPSVVPCARPVAVLITLSWTQLLSHCSVTDAACTTGSSRAGIAWSVRLVQSRCCYVCMVLLPQPAGPGGRNSWGPVAMVAPNLPRAHVIGELQAQHATQPSCSTRLFHLSDLDLLKVPEGSRSGLGTGSQGISSHSPGRIWPSKSPFSPFWCPPLRPKRCCLCLVQQSLCGHR